MSVLELVTLLRRSNKDFVVYPPIQKSFTPLGYDLSVGAAVTLVSKALGSPSASYDAFETSETPQKINIPPKSALSIVTREKVWLSGRVSGFLFSRGSYASQGLVLSASTIDPNWEGQMLMRLFNSNDHDIDIDCTQPFVTMVLWTNYGTCQSVPSSHPMRVLDLMKDKYPDSTFSPIYRYVNRIENQKESSEFALLVERAKRYQRKWRLQRWIIDAAEKLPFRNWLLRAVAGTFLMCVGSLLATYVIVEAVATLTGGAVLQSSSPLSLAIPLYLGVFGIVLTVAFGVFTFRR